MVNYVYYNLLPEKIGDLITNAVKGFADEKREKRSYDAWYHGLPIWIVRERSNSRVNKVQIEAILAEPASGPVISFTPDAYEDQITYDRGLKKVQSKVASGEDILKRRKNVPLGELSNFAVPQVVDLLKKTLETASGLDLDGADMPPLEYATPFK